MDTTTATNLVQTMSGLIVALVGVIAVTPVLTLGTVALVIRAVRHNPQLEQAIRALYLSTPPTVQKDVQAVGDALIQASGLIGDVTTTITNTNTAAG